jgi:hypothetical protein
VGLVGGDGFWEADVLDMCPDTVAFAVEQDDA